MTNEYNVKWNIFGIWILKSVFQLPPHPFPRNLHVTPLPKAASLHCVTPLSFYSPPPDNYLFSVNFRAKRTSGDSFLYRKKKI